MKKGIIIDEKTNKVLSKFDQNKKSLYDEKPKDHSEIFEVNDNLEIINPDNVNEDYDKIRLGDIIDEDGYKSRETEVKRHRFVDKEKVLGKEIIRDKEYIEKDKELTEKEKKKAEKKLGMTFDKTTITKRRDIDSKEKKKLKEKLRKNTERKTNPNEKQEE